MQTLKRTSKKKKKEKTNKRYIPLQKETTHRENMRAIRLSRYEDTACGGNA